ncbi:MAG: RnfABCDGE type electron transport complex subunit D, partial [Planctomycetes bacterium]|nr:RnfABCDGE type electron transport complex subunit D [Planctomycetota bacterium]
KLGRVIFGVGVGALIMLIRLVGGLPEGIMYAILLMNAMTPLLDRWTRPTPLGGHARAS